MAAGLFRTLRAMYWSAGRNRRRGPHLMAALCHAFVTAVRLLVRRFVTERAPIVAISLLEHLGDIVAAEPISRFARLHHPGSKVLWIARPAFASLPEQFYAVDDVVPVLCLTEWMLLRSLRIIDVVWDLHVAGRMCPICAIPQPVHAPAPPGLDIDSYFRSGNLLAVQCLSAGLPILCDAPWLPRNDRAAIELASLQIPQTFIVIHCRSDEARKDWPQPKWHALLDQLEVATDLIAIEIGLTPAAILHDSPRRRSLCGALSIAQTAALIRMAQLFVGIDGGPAHLANAVGTPAVLLFGRYREFARYMPFSGGFESGELADILWADGPVTRLDVAPVLAAVLSRLRRGNAPARQSSA